MARTAPSTSHEQSAALRQLKLLVVLLVLSNIGLGLFSFYLLRRLDRQYSDLVGRSVSVLNDLQMLTVKTIAAMRATNFTGAPYVGERHKAVTEDRNFRDQLLRAAGLVVTDAERSELRSAGDEFTRAALGVLAEVAAGRPADAARKRDDSLRSAFDRYIVATTKVTDGLEASSLQANQAMSVSTGSMSKVVLAVASWPVLLLLGLLFLTAIFILVLMILFRGREAGDLP